jgi:hypothetical protein
VLLAAAVCWCFCCHCLAAAAAACIAYAVAACFYLAQQLGYDGYGNKATLGAFLFTWPDGDLSQQPHKLPKISTDQMAIVDGLDQGLHFGCGDLKMLMQRGSPRRATCKLIDYQRLPGDAGGVPTPLDDCLWLGMPTQIQI